MKPLRSKQSDSFSQKPKLRRKAAYFATGVTAATLLTGCGSSPDAWENAPGTNGIINLDAVKEAFQKNPDVNDFELRVNEIFEGDNLILLKTEGNPKGFTCAAYEDLDQNKSVSDGDEKLFTLWVEGNTARLVGNGPNAYYRESWPYNPQEEKEKVAEEKTNNHYHGHHYHPFLYWYGGRGYYSSAPNYDSIRNHRDQYRTTSAFADQVQKNTGFTQQASQTHGTFFEDSAKKPTIKREAYINRMMRSGRSESTNNGWSVRKASGISSNFSTTRASYGGSSSHGFSSSKSSGGFGGFRGSSGVGIG